jgi:hypothetical protein
VITYSPAFSATPIFLCHDDTYDGGNTCSARFRNNSTGSVEVFIEEEQSLDSEVGHVDEVVSYLAWGAAGDIMAQGAAAMSGGIDAGPAIDAGREMLAAGPDDMPAGFGLARNYPNPFNPVTTIRFSLEREGHARIEIFNVAGRRVATLIDRMMPAGEHAVPWNAAGHASGVYFCRLTQGGRSVISKMVLLQ